MEINPRLKQEFQTLVAVQKALAAISGRDDEARRMELVNLRRELSQRLMALSKASEQDERLKADPDLQAGFRTKFSAMRYAIALHQADWPAVSIDHTDVDYKRSASHVSKANKEFAEWIQSNMGF